MVPVPRSLWQIIGKRRLERTLKTHDLAEARRLRWKVAGELQEIIAAARSPAASTGDGLTDEALDLKHWAETLPDGDPDGLLQIALEQRAKEITKASGKEAASQFWRTAVGVGTPLLKHMEGWLAELPCPPRSKVQHRGTLKELERFCRTEKARVEVEAVTKPLAGRWLAQALAAAQARDTIARKLSTFREFWRWMAARDHVAVNRKRFSTALLHTFG